MIGILAQTTQPVRWIWTNLDATEIGMIVGAWSVMAYAILGLVSKVGLRVIEVWFGWKSAARKEREALARASNVTDRQPSPEDVARLNALANSETTKG